MWRQSSVWKWAAGVLHMISVCVLAALIIAFIILNGGGRNHWRQIVDDSNAGKPYAESRFLAETVGNGLPELFTGVERGEMLHHTFYTEQLLRFKGAGEADVAWGAADIMEWDGEFESMQRMLEDTGVMTTSSDGRQFVYLTGIHTIRNHVNWSIADSQTSGYAITSGTWTVDEETLYEMMTNYQEFGWEFSNYYCPFSGFQNVVAVVDVDGAVYSSLPNETESSMGAVGIQGLSASGLLSQYQQGVETVEVNGAQMRFLYVNGDGTRELMRDSFSAIGEYLDSQAQIRENAVIVLLEAVEYPFYDTIRDGMYFYEIGGKLYTWIPIGIVCCGLIWLISLCYLFASAGRRKGERACFLAYGDRMSGETMLVLHGIIGGIVGGVLIGVGGSEPDLSFLWRIVLVGTGIFLWYMEIIWILLRIVRRVRVGLRYWDTSLIHRMGRGVRHMFGYFKASTRVILAFLLYILGNMLALAMTPSPFGYLLLFGMQIAAVLLLLKRNSWIVRIDEGVGKIADGSDDYKINVKEMYAGSLEKNLAEHINQMGGGFQEAVRMATKNERMKAELITNVSHDIKTPLTSIINYVDLIKREGSDNEKIRGYIQILDQKSQRLKQLIEDLVEVSKANTGNIELEMTELNLMELVKQAVGELSDKFQQRNLTVVANIMEEPAIIQADGRRLWRVLENLLGNACKYSLPGSRVYVDTKRSNRHAAVIIKNVSESPLNIPAEELMERFTRGDTARTTEGSGLGLSIAKSLTELMGGKLHLYLDGDLFRVTLEFPRIEDWKKMKPTEKTASEGEAVQGMAGKGQEERQEVG